MNLQIPSILLAAALCLTPSLSAQNGVLDQAVEQDNVFYNMAFFNDFQQNVEVGISGDLQGIEIQMSTTDISVGMAVSVFLGPGPHASTPAWTGTAYNTSVGVTEWVYVDCSSAGLNFNAGDIFTIRIGDTSILTPEISLVGNSGWPNPNYPHDFWEALSLRTLDRMTFRTYVEPPAPVLSATGVCGGSMTFDVTSGTGNYWLVYGNAGSSVVFGVDLAIDNPQLATTMGAQLIANVPAGACGKTVQAVDMQYMIASNPIVL